MTSEQRDEETEQDEENDETKISLTIFEGEWVGKGPLRRNPLGGW